MTTVVVRQPAARDMADDLFADITPSPFAVSWEPPELVIAFDDELLPAQVLSVRLRVLSLDANEETIFRQAWHARQTNLDYLNNPRTQAAVIAEVDALARQVNGLLRVLLGLYDGTD